MRTLHISLSTNSLAPAKAACGRWLDGLHPNGYGGVTAVDANTDRARGFAKYDAEAKRPIYDRICKRCANARKQFAV